jgi:hypothetical protein
LLIDATVEEIDRGRMQAGDDVIVRVDALPEVSMEVTLTDISPLAELASGSRTRSFHVFASLGEKADPRVRPGMNGSMDIVVERIPDTLIIPAQALFTRNGKPVVYEVGSDTFRTVEVEVLARNSDEIAVAGLSPDARVTLVDPLVFAEAGARDEEGGGE